MRNTNSRWNWSRSWRTNWATYRANKPIEVKLFGPDQKVLRGLAEQVGEILEKKGKGRGIKEVTTNVFAGNPDLLVQLDSAKAERTA